MLVFYLQCKNRKIADNLLFNENQMYNALNNTMNHDLSQMFNDSNHLINENCIINDTTVLKNQNSINGECLYILYIYTIQSVTITI